MNFLERSMNKLLGKKVDNNDKMILKSRCIRKGKYEILGVIFDAESHEEAIRKYRRARDETKDI